GAHFHRNQCYGAFDLPVEFGAKAVAVGLLGKLPVGTIATNLATVADRLPAITIVIAGMEKSPADRPHGYRSDVQIVTDAQLATPTILGAGAIGLNSKILCADNRWRSTD